MSPANPINTDGADPVTNAQQAARWTAQANKLAADDYLVGYNNWLLNKDVRKGLGLPAQPEPQAPKMIHFAWVEGQGQVMSVGPELVSAPPPVHPSITEVGKIDDVVGGEVADKPGHRYNLGLSTQKWTHVSGPPTRIWTLVQEGMFTTYWTELVIPGGS